MMRVFVPLWSKDISSLSNFIDDQLFINHISGKPFGDLMTLGQLIMHDQEPILNDSMYNYQSLLREQQKEWSEEGFIDRLSPAELLSVHIRCANIPIICHSEKNSDEIKELKKHLFVDCYYWWHGMISRDWFRHYEYHADLEPRLRERNHYRFLLYARDCTGTRQYRRSIIDYLSTIKEQVKFDWDQKESPTSDLSASIDVSDARRCGIHLVAETLFETKKVHLTEKIFKPIVMSQPFFLFGPPGSLQYLREYGFKTFDGVFDESYDLETDHDKRMSLLFREIDKWALVPERDFERIRSTQLMPIIEHNRKWFYSKDFQEKLIKEMFSNMDQAINEQQTLKSSFPGGQWCWMMDNFLSRGRLPEPLFYRTKDLLSSPLMSHQLPELTKKYPELVRVFG